MKEMDENDALDQQEQTSGPEKDENETTEAPPTGETPPKEESPDTSLAPPTAEAPDTAETPPAEEPAPTAEAPPAREPAPTAEAPDTAETPPAEEPAPTAEAPPADKTPPKAKTAPAELIDDSEEQQINAGYDDEVDTAETSHPDEAILAAEVEKVLNGDNGDAAEESTAVEETIAAADAEASVEEAEAAKQAEPEPEAEKEAEPEKEPEPMVDYSLLSKDDLVELFKEKLDNPGQEGLREIMEAIRKAYTEKRNAEIEATRKAFLDEGGKEEDFKPVEDPADVNMKDYLHKYRGLRAEQTRQLEKDKQSNLTKKQEILVSFRGLMESQGQENFELTFRKFKDLQKQWFATGVVPHQNLKDLWDSYNYFVDKFNDYVRINRDLRALDLKKNMELKIQLCERTEALDQEENVVQAFRVLQKNHARWREIGPVPRENRDEIWDRFKAATSVINRKHQEFHSRMKESLHENLEKKQALCDQVEAIAAGEYSSHGAWASRTKEVLEIQKTWKTIGYAPKKDNNAVYARFRAACDAFFGSKARFYSAAFEEQKENLKLKMEIVEKAESLSSSEDWKETTTELIRLQKEWKEIGPVPRRDSDKLWKRFRSACDAFFNNKSSFFKDSDASFSTNLEEKEKLLSEMEAYKAEGNKKEVLADLKAFQERYASIGFVPSEKKEEIRERYRIAQDHILDHSGMDPDQVSKYKFRSRIESIQQAPRARMKLNFERDKLMNKLQTMRNDISVWENNVGFFKQSDSSESTIAEYHERIESAHKRIKQLEDKIRMIDNLENVN